MVSIPQWCDCCCSATLTLTPSRRVSIPQWCDCCWVEAFQVLKRVNVSIPQWCDCCRSFGSVAPNLYAFQSHNGAIAAFARLGISVTDATFQSHNGAIAASTTEPAFERKLRFNPTMVRLLQDGSALQCDRANVSIPQWCDCCGGWTK